MFPSKNSLIGGKVWSQDLCLGLILIPLLELFVYLVLEQHMTMTIEHNIMDTNI